MLKIVASFAILALGTSFALAEHVGPTYPSIPQACSVDKTSATRDCSDGNTITWSDGFNQKHTVTLQKGEMITVVFPIPQGGTWIWHDDDQERTGFNRAASWAEVTFSYNGGDVDIRSTGWIAGESAPGLLEEALKSIKTHADLVTDAVRSGATTVEEILKILDSLQPEAAGTN